jgi:AraC-like DNA-binding protein
VRQLLVASPGHLPGIEETAERLHVSSRTLRRRLDREGTTFRRLVDEVRRRLAEDLLTAGELSVEQIAHRLGYGATPAFSAAFTRWTGVSPREYRRGRVTSPGR